MINDDRRTSILGDNDICFYRSYFPLLLQTQYELTRKEGKKRRIRNVGTTPRTRTPTTTKATTNASTINKARLIQETETKF